MRREDLPGTGGIHRRTRGGPGVATVGGAPQPLAASPQTRGRIRVHHEGIDELETVGNAGDLVRPGRTAIIRSLDADVVVLGKQLVGVRRIDGHVAAIATDDFGPAVQAGSVGAAIGAIVLGAAEVGRAIRINVTVIELGNAEAQILVVPGRRAQVAGRRPLCL